MRDERAADVVEGGGRALCATGVEDVDGLPDMVVVKFFVVVVRNEHNYTLEMNSVTVNGCDTYAKERMSQPASAVRIQEQAK